ncbi:cyanovirin-N homolog [Selaginella moellendorffii]|uniref:cyanovirin-N homolog n=1 Tax=Selaginella moellendorffii TaxID=88036 RepID=UPI000D1C2D9D|nr:cyanovirin-N homolog [Selaginella moellendorffii]|eukprot:XP_024520435.1 cyanovirin-N homolog [Selaginella moellendorffii]
MASSSSPLGNSMLLLFLLVAALTASTSKACEGFAGSCKDIFVKGPVLEAECMNNRGWKFYSAVDISKCITYGEDGKLKCGERFTYGLENCRGIEYLTSGTMMEGECKNTDGEYVASTLDLNDCIGNINGFLRCASLSDECVNRHKDE